MNINLISKFYQYLCEHGFPVQGCHDTLITVHSYASVVKGFFGVSQFVPQICHATLEDAPKVAGDQSAANTYNRYLIR